MKVYTLCRSGSFIAEPCISCLCGASPDGRFGPITEVHERSLLEMHDSVQRAWLRASWAGWPLATYRVTTCFALRTCGAELIEPLPDFSSSHAKRSAGCVVRKKNGVAHVRGPLSLHRDETGCVGPDATGGAISQGRGSWRPGFSTWLSCDESSDTTAEVAIGW